MSNRIDVSLVEGMRFEALGQDNVTVTMDSSTEHGGVGGGLRPMELLLAGLGGCTGMDVISILRKKRQKVTGYRIEVTGEQAEEYPHVYTSIHIHHALTGDTVREDAVRRAIQLSEDKYCSAYAMLAKSARITSDFEIGPEPSSRERAG